MSMRAGAATARAFARTAAVKAEQPAILTCAVSGGLVTTNPNQPVSRDDVIVAAVDAARAGASVLHIHARTPSGEMTQAPEDYLAIKQAIREQVDDVLLELHHRRASWARPPRRAAARCSRSRRSPR